MLFDLSEEPSAPAVDKAGARGAVRPARATTASEMRKQAKAQEKMLELQRNGYYKTEEVSLVLPEDIYGSPLGGAILAHVMFAADNNKSYGCLAAPSTVPGLCRWTYRSYLDGGNANIGDAGSVVIPFVVVVFPPRDFLELVDVSLDGEDFPQLLRAVQRLRAQMELEQCPASSKLVLLLLDVDDECKQFKKDQAENSSKGRDCTRRKVTWSMKIDEAVAFLLYTCNIDVVMRPSSGGEYKQAAQYFETATRCLGEQAALQGHKTGLETVKRISSKREEGSSCSGSVKNSFCSEDSHLQHIFSCMLQVVPGVSRAKADRLLQFYPYPQSLLEALADPRVPETERVRLLADKLDPKRSCVKLAAQLYKIFTTLDALEPLS